MFSSMRESFWPSGSALLPDPGEALPLLETPRHIYIPSPFLNLTA